MLDDGRFHYQHELRRSRRPQCGPRTRLPGRRLERPEELCDHGTDDVSARTQCVQLAQPRQLWYALSEHERLHLWASRADADTSNIALWGVCASCDRPTDCPDHREANLLIETESQSEKKAAPRKLGLPFFTPALQPRCKYILAGMQPGVSSVMSEEDSTTASQTVARPTSGQVVR